MSVIRYLLGKILFVKAKHSSESKNISSALHIVYRQPAACLKGLLERRAVFCHERVLLAS